MRGVLVYNGSFINHQVTGMLESFARAFKNSGAKLEVIVSGDFTVVYGSGEKKLLYKGKEFEKGEADFVLFWDKNIRLAAAFEASGIPVFNNSRAIEVCDNKLDVYEKLASHNVPVPLTIAAPFIYNNREPGDYSGFLRETADILGFPIVVKEAYGSLGMQVYLANGPDELNKMYNALKHKPHLYQKFIEESRGTDIRVYTIGGKAVGACERRNSQDFRSNVLYGGQMSLIAVDREYIDIAQTAARILGLDYCAVDFLKGKEGPLLCEINSNAFFNTYVSLGGADIAKEYAEYIVRKITNYRLQITNKDI